MVRLAVSMTNVGDCTEAAGDFSSRDSIISPGFTMPADVTAAKLSFDHYVATEGGFDGGNVKVSVNGGAFTQIPLSAFVFNPYNDHAGGRPTRSTVRSAFSGTDGGVPGRVVGHHDRRPGRARRDCR